MAGSTLGSGDMVKNMGAFNDAIFSLNRNLKLGVKAEDIQGMFKALYILRHGRTQAAVAGNPTGHNQTLCGALIKGSTGLGHQYITHRRLEGGA